MFIFSLIISQILTVLFTSDSLFIKFTVDLLSIIIFWTKVELKKCSNVLPVDNTSHLYKGCALTPLSGCIGLCLSQLVGYNSLPTQRWVLEILECPSQ